MALQFSRRATAKAKRQDRVGTRLFLLLPSSTFITVICLGAAFCQTPGNSTIGTNREEKRKITVADSISTTDFASPLSPGPIFSPDASRFIVVLKRGNLERNTVDYSILLWRSADLTEASRPTAVATLSSSSNRPAVADLRWLNDNAITFLGENPGEERQLYTLDVNTKVISKLTRSPTSVMAYAISADAETLVFAAEPPRQELFTAQDQQHGFHVGRQSLTDLVTGQTHSHNLEMFAVKRTSGRAVRLKLNWRLSSSIFSVLSLSPDGKSLIIPLHFWPDYVPAKWKEYQAWPPPDHQHYLVNTETGQARPLIDAPMSGKGSELIWLPDGHSVVISRTYLPLDVDDSAERNRRTSKLFTVEVEIPNRKILPIDIESDVRVSRWDKEIQGLVLTREQRSAFDAKQDEFFYVKKSGKWEQVVAPTKRDRNIPDIRLEENLNQGPRIVLTDPKSGHTSVLMDLNPHFKNLEFGKLQEITWTATDGHEVTGGLYLPPDYVHSKRYPLIIQTHGWYPRMSFVAMDGFPAPPNAAQGLASKGFVVVQVPLYGDKGSDMVSLNGTKKEVSAYEGVIEHLDRAGVIDRKSVGIIGFSWTSLTVKYTLTHSSYRFAAAAVSDGPDVGYFQYILASNANAAYLSQAHDLNGAAPFGTGLTAWLNNSPGFAIDQVSAPVLIEAVEGVDSLLWEWEWFGALTALHKPVDMLYIANGAHELVKPWERLAAQQTSVDWFCFWIKHEEDPAPARAEQYARWRELRKLQKQSEKNSPTPSPN
jgi:dipeptidyl aminopeptidase/acylaminoacyl peptidase